ncbi:MAG: hypothetical protein IKZ34_01310 [Alphaproteobacteria bacterium]|nr:hypothetical protein [Alphaproteobacteria bacterium]
MKKLIIFFAGLLLLMTMFASLFLTGAIYDTSKKITIETFFFQPDDSFKRRPGVPASPTDLGADTVRNMLISRYITELFYAIPDEKNIVDRMAGGTSLYKFSSDEAFDYWLQNIAPSIETLTKQNKLRLVQLTGVEQTTIEKNYWIIDYDLITWEKPNDMSIAPTVTHGKLYLRLVYQAGMLITRDKKSVLDMLEAGTDPAAAFNFIVQTISLTEIDEDL